MRESTAAQIIYEWRSNVDGNLVLTKTWGYRKCVRLLDEMMRLPYHERFSILTEAKVLYEAKVHSHQHAADSLAVDANKKLWEEV